MTIEMARERLEKRSEELRNSIRTASIGLFWAHSDRIHRDRAEWHIDMALVRTAIDNARRTAKMVKMAEKRLERARKGGAAQ